MCKTITNRIVAMIIAIFSILTFMCEFMSQANAYDGAHDMTGCFNYGTAYTSSHDVYTNGKAARIRVCSFYKSGNASRGKFKVRVVSDDGVKHYYTRTGRGTIRIPSGHRHYRISIRRLNKTSTNLKRCYYWSFEALSNCNFKWPER